MPESYLLVAVGLVLGVCSDRGLQLWQRAREERRRQAYFRDVDALAHRLRGR